MQAFLRVVERKGFDLNILTLFCCVFCEQLYETNRIQTLSAMAENKQENVAEATTVEATETPKVEVQLSEAQTNPEKFLKEFDWHNYEEGIEQVADSKLAEFEKLVSENFVDTLDDEVVEGTVIAITDRDAIIDINAKSEGVI